MTVSGTLYWASHCTSTEQRGTIYLTRFSSVSQDSKTTCCNATIAGEVSAAASPPMEKGNVTTLSAKCKERNMFKMDDCGWLPVMQLYICVLCADQQWQLKHLTWRSSSKGKRKVTTDDAMISRGRPRLCHVAPAFNMHLSPCMYIPQ